MDDRERFEYELQKRLESDLWDAGISARVLKRASAAKKVRLSLFAGAAAAAIAVAAVTAGLNIGSGAGVKPEADALVMQQINGTYNSSVGSSSVEYSDPVDAEIADALWTR